MRYTQEQARQIYQDAQSRGLDPDRVMAELVNQGATFDGIDIGEATRFANRKLDIKPTVGERITETFGDIKEIGTGIIRSGERRAENIAEVKALGESGDITEQGVALRTVGQLAGAGADAIGEVVKGIIKVGGSQQREDDLKLLVGELGKDVAKTEPVQNLVNWYEGLDDRKRTAVDAAGGVLDLALEFVGVGLAKRGAKATGEAVKTGVKQTLGTAGDVVETGARAVDEFGTGVKKVGEAVSENIPTKGQVVDFEVTRALGFTQGDVKNMLKSTGNNPGNWVAEKNLIGTTKAETLANVKEFGDQAFKEVRGELDKVTKTFKQSEIPRYKQALTEIAKVVDNTPGLEDASKEVAKLLKKRKVTANDIQRVKELMDKHFNLFKVTGGVKESAAKEGLANMRRELKEFLEAQVKEATGSDIKQLNNDVSTAMSIGINAADRAQRGLTRSVLSIGDIGIFGAGTVVGGPLTGVALVLGKKLLETPGLRLRIAKWLDGLSDAKRLRIQQELEAGNVPKELDTAVKNAEKELNAGSEQ